jgi:glycosyltransferase involved in cell wall biosynthesis
MTKRPKVTVLMSVYNSEDYIREAIESVLGQTFKDFEFLIINDGSTDKSLKIIKSYKDARIRLIDRENWGLTRSLNQGLKIAKGEYIARQDSDDASVPDRLEKQVAFLDSHPNAGMIGSNYTITDLKGKPKVTTNVFTHPADLKLCQVTCNQFGHGSVMMRKRVIDKVGGYDAMVGYVEDYDLWTRISRVADIANFEEPLYLYKSNDKGVSLQNQELQIKQTFAVRDKAFKHFRSHRWQYRIYSYHPSGQDYRRRKSTLYRNLAYLYREDGSVIRAAHMLLVAIMFTPKNKRNYRLLAKTLLKPRAPSWEFEFL